MSTDIWPATQVLDDLVDAPHQTVGFDFGAFHAEHWPTWAGLPASELGHLVEPAPMTDPALVDEEER